MKLGKLPTLSFWDGLKINLTLGLGFTHVFDPVHRLSKMGDLATAKLGWERFYFCYHPRHAEYVLHEKLNNFPKLTPTFTPKAFKIIHATLGNGLLTVEGEAWRTQKQRLTPRFLGPVIESFQSSLKKIILDLLKELACFAQKNQSLDLSTILRKIPLLIIFKILFSDSLHGEVNRMDEVLRNFSIDFNKRFSFLTPPYWIPTPWNKKHRSGVDYLTKLIAQFYEARKQTQEFPPDIMSLLMEARDPKTGQALSFQQIRDELVTLLFGGHDTTAYALAWTFYLIITHPEWEERLLREWNFVEGIPDFDSLPNLIETKMVIQESLRLFPPVWSISRSCLTGDQIDGHPIVKDCTLVLSLYHIHRHPEFWENPDQFDPMRFHPSKLESINKFAYLPFIHGPHSCLGRELAMFELLTAIPAIFSAFKFTMAKDARVEPEFAITTRTKYGLKVNLALR